MSKKEQMDALAKELISMDMRKDGYEKMLSWFKRMFELSPEEALKRMMHFFSSIGNDAQSLEELKKRLGAHPGWESFPFETMMKITAEVLFEEFSAQDFVKVYNEDRGVLPEIDTYSWFVHCGKPKDGTSLAVQVGCHLEEVREMFPEMTTSNEEVNDKLLLIDTLLNEVGNILKSGKETVTVTNKEKFLNAVVDQRVTGAGCAYFADLDYAEAVARTDWSNWTKPVNLQFLFKEGGKIAKGPYFWEPEKK